MTTIDIVGYISKSIVYGYSVYYLLCLLRYLVKLYTDYKKV